ncbi:uncharacterized protein CLUP02_06338, partial [Colletotrichum lupini]
IIRISFSLSKEIVALSIIEVKTYFRTITFYILPVNTPFLLYLKDIDRLGIIFNNIRNRIFNTQSLRRFKFKLYNKLNFN